MDRPNILWFCTDQQRFDTIGALGFPGVATPTVDRLVRSGVAFTRCYVQSPICTPSRASFLTGRYPSSVRTTRNGNAFFPPEPRLVTRLLADAGWACGLVGKLHLASAYGRIEPRAEDGYELFAYSHAPRDDWRVGHAYADWVRARGASLAELTASLDGVPAELHQTTWACATAAAFALERRDRPWLLSVNVYDPHPPFNPPASYRALFDPARMPPPLFRPSDLAQQAKLAVLDFQSKARDPHELDIEHPILAKPPARGLYAADDPTPGTRATMWFDGRHKLSLYHDHGLAELYDLEADPGEFENLWGRPGNAALERDLVRASFDATVRAIDLGPPRIGPM